MILLTGDSGFLGRYIKNDLLSHNVLFQTINRNNADYKIDLSATVPIFRINFDLVIHCAGAAYKIPKNQL